MVDIPPFLFMTQNITLINADVITGLKSIDKNSIDTIITSPPYFGLRDYLVDGQIGMESTLEDYHDKLLVVTKLCKRVLKPSGVMFWNHGDSYGGSGGSGGDYNDGGLRDGQPKVGKSVGTTPKCLTMQNERLIIKMIDNQNWILRNRIIWYKVNGMPSSAQDRFTGKYEPVYMLTKRSKYHFDLDAVRIPAKYQEVWSRKGSAPGTPYESTGNNPRSRWGLTKHEIATDRTSGSYSDPLHTKPGSGMKNPGDVWTIPTQPHKDAHFAIFPDKLVEPMIKAACPLKVCPVCGFIQEKIIKEIRGEKVSSLGPTKNDGNPTKGGSTYKPLIDSYITGYTSCECDTDYEPGTVLDPFAGSGTTMKVAKELGRNAIGIELSSEYCDIIKRNLLFHQYTLGNIVNKFIKL